MVNLVDPFVNEKLGLYSISFIIFKYKFSVLYKIVLIIYKNFKFLHEQWNTHKDLY